MAVYVSIVMPLDRYDEFVSKLDPSSRAYEVMQNVVIERSPKEGRFVRTARITCRKEDAEILLDHANRLYPDAVPEIRKAIG